MKPNAWKPPLPQSRTRWWLVHRALPVSVLVACLVLFVVLVAQPLFHPRVHLLFAAAHYLDGRLDCSSPAEDLAALDIPPIALLGKAKAREAKAADPCSSPAALAAALDRADRGAVREGDVLIVWLAGEVVSRDGQLDFVCEDFNPADLTSCCMPLAQVFDRVRSSPAATKLLVLDTGRVNHLPRLGKVADTASNQIEQMVGQQRDPSLWVLLAHRELERSHVLGGSRRSALAHFASEALQGAADANADRYVDVGEFYRYVRDHVSGFVEEETRGRDAQTPRLLWGGGAWSMRTSFPLLLPVKAPARSESSEAAGEEAKEGEAKEGGAKEGEAKEAEAKETEAKRGKEAKEAKPEEVPHLSAPPSALLAQHPPGFTIDGSAGLPDSGPAQTANSEAKGKMPGEPAAGDKPSASDAVLAAAPPEVAAMAWAVHDRLAASARLRPVSTAPQLWRAFEDVLIAHELALQAGDARRLDVLTPELRRLVRQASDLAEGRMPQRYRPRDIVPDLALAAAPAASDVPAHSLAMARRLMDHGSPPLSREVMQAVERLDRALAASDKAELQKFAKELPAWADRWIEFRTARSLAARDDLSWDEVKLVLSARRAAEAVAAATLDAGAWARLSVERADALRLRGQQLVLQAVRPGDAAAGATLLREAIAEYEKAAAWNQDAVALQETIDAALFDLPDYLRWSVVSLAAAEHSDMEGDLLARLLAELRQAFQVIDAPSPAQLPEVRRLRLGLEDTLAKMRRRANRSLGLPSTGEPDASASGPGADAPVSPYYSGLAASDMRRRLLALSLGVPPADTAKSAAPAAFEVRDPVHRLQPVLANFAKAMSLLESSHLAPRNVGGARPEPPAKGVGVAEQGDYNAARQLGEAVRARLQGLPQEIARIAADNQDLSDPSQRAGRLRQLAAARRMLNLVDPWDVDRMEGPGPALPLRRARLYDLLVWQQQRLTSEAISSPPAERLDLQSIAENYARAAAAIPLQPRIAAPPSAGVALDAVAQIDLAEKAERDVQLTVVNHDPARRSVWIAADYDPEVLGLSSPESEGAAIYEDGRTDRVQAELTGPMSVPVADPQSAGFRQPEQLAPRDRAPTCVLAGGESRGLWVRLRRKTLAGGDARVIFHALAAPEHVRQSTHLAPQDGKHLAERDEYIAATTSFRHDLLVELPRRLAVDLVAEGIDDTWQASETGLVLYPFPNHATAYRFALVNTSAVERDVSLDIYCTETPTAAVPPRGDVPASIADQYLARVGRGALVAHVDKMVLPATGERVAVPFPPPGGDAKADKAPAAAGAAPPPALSPVLAVVVTDHGSNRRAVKTIEILTQRPARYLRAKAEYDPLRRRLDMVFRAVKPGALPADGVRIVAAPQVQESEELYHADATIRGGASEASLHVEVPRDMTEVYPVSVEVDGFARAFCFDVATRAGSPVTVPEVSRAAIRILKPKAGTLYGPQATDVPVEMEVDVPHGLLLDSSNCVEVGIDTNRDRLLEHEETVRLTSDRQVDLAAEELGPRGRFVVGTKVKDLKLKLQPPARRALRANILARILLPTSVVWSEPVEVIFDDRPPQLSQLQLEPGDKVPEGDDLVVSVLAGDNDLSGVAKVEAAFDLQRKGEFGTPPPVAGFMQADGRWVIALPTKPLKPGLHTVLVRATDRCDNASDYLKATVEVVPKPAPGAEAAKPQLGQITGQVVYGRFEKRPVAGALVQLTASAATGPPPRETTTDDNGAFRFRDVPPGDYKLASEKLLGGNRRVAEGTVKVVAPPQATPAVDLVLETARQHTK